MTRMTFALGRVLAAVATAAAALYAAPGMAFADKPVKLIVPAPAGGTMDVAARTIGDLLSKQIKQPVVVENRPGASGAIAIKHMLSQPADGSTLMVTASNVLTEVPHVLKGGFDPLKDIQPLAQMAQSTLVLVAGPQFPAKTFKEAVDYVRANPQKVTYASYAAGTASQYAGAMLNQKAGLDMQHVAFQGSAPALVQVMGGQIPLMFDGAVTSRPYIKAGRLHLLGVAAAQRLPDYPNVPTLAEMGYPDLKFSNWVGVVGSAKLPQAQAERIHAELQTIAASPAFKQRMTELGFDLLDKPRTLEQAAADVREDHARNAGIVKSFGIKLQ